MFNSGVACIGKVWSIKGSTSSDTDDEDELEVKVLGLPFEWGVKSYCIPGSLMCLP